MREPFGISKARRIVGRQISPCQCRKVGESAAQVDRDVEHLAPEAVHQLVLGVRRMLEMQPARRRPARVRVWLIWRDRSVPAGRAQLVVAEQPAEGSRARPDVGCRST